MWVPERRSVRKEMPSESSVSTWAACGTFFQVPDTAWHPLLEFQDIDFAFQVTLDQADLPTQSVVLLPASVQRHDWFPTPI